MNVTPHDEKFINDRSAENGISISSTSGHMTSNITEFHYGILSTSGHMTTNTTYFLLEMYKNITDNEDPFYGRLVYTALVPSVWILLVLVGTFGNGIVIYTLCRNGEMTASNCYIINLAIADMTFLFIVVPSTAASYSSPDWLFGDFICRITTYMIYVTLHATSFTLTAMTIDRYYAIVHPLSSINWRNRRISTITCLIVWTVSCFISIPFALYHMVINKDDHVYCQEAWPDENVGKVILITVTATNYVIPLTIIVVCYTRILRNLHRGYRRHARRCIESTTDLQQRRKKRVTRMVALIILMFAICWFPIHVVNIYTKVYPEFPKTEAMFIIKVLAHTLSYTNSCLNPIIYAFLNDIFRKSFLKTFPFVSKFSVCMYRNTEEQPENSRYTNMVDQAIQASTNDPKETSSDFIQRRNILDTKLL